MTIVLLTGLFCIIPTFMFWSRDFLGNGYSFAWFIVLYITAAYIRLYSDEIPQKRKSVRYALVYLILSGGYNKSIDYRVSDRINNWWQTRRGGILHI